MRELENDLQAHFMENLLLLLAKGTNEIRLIHSGEFTKFDFACLVAVYSIKELREDLNIQATPSMPLRKSRKYLWFNTVILETESVYPYEKPLTVSWKSGTGDQTDQTNPSSTGRPPVLKNNVHC